jgi:c-di-GMP-related signal transduction protein
MLERIINLSPYKEISITKKTDHHTLIEKATIIVEFDEDYYVIQDDIEKIKDVSQMPSYIKEDWLNYNKKELTNEILELHILYYVKKLDFYSSNNDDILEIVNKLKSIKRHQIIKKIL